ncbi:MAG: class I SAM-dependent methyltransferase [Gammaproteobacteria bacterium]|nr:class I SAM-dependent methyltransferase [Gammaproteobacteria bacterium]
MDHKQHWEDVYSQKPEDSLSWFQPRPEISLELIHAAGLPKTAALIDVGGGASRLVDCLLAEGFSDVTVLDIAEHALQKTQSRLGDLASRAHWIVADVTRWNPERQYRLWHDRAVFHFLTDATERAAYRKNLEAALAPGGTAITASFALEGPERCSGLPVQRYSPETLSAELGPKFHLTAHRQETHHTPADRIQQFQYSVFEYRPTKDGLSATQDE